MKEQGVIPKLLDVQNISKAFYGNKVLDDVSFDLDYGEVLGLVGQNGAGKSTLVKILTGAYQPDSGDIYIEGKLAKLNDIHTANNSGVALVFQELSLAPNLTVAENIFIGNIPTDRLGIVDKRKLYQETQKLLSKFAVNIKPDDLIQNLSIGKRQIVEILKAISKQPMVLILDEPTSSLEEAEINVLFNFIEELKKNRLSIIYISHHMSEIFRIVDRVMILRDGNKVGMFNRDEIDVKELIGIMINQDFDSFFGNADKGSLQENTILGIKNFTKESVFRDINLEVKKGEILGITGIVGCGKNELCKAIYGATKIEKGEVYLEGVKISIKDPSDAKRSGVILLPENRKNQGLFLNDSIQNNTIACILPKVSRYGFLNKEKIREVAERYINKLKIKLSSQHEIIRFLSGGNQQKVLVAKCVAAEPKLLITMDPTRGIDVGSKADIHRHLHGLARKGLAIIMVTADIDELINICDRIVVMNNGMITKTFLHDQFNTGQILLSMHQS
ncbi:MAG TPA: sugar ABC transporter ATP-binding protein [Clostridia bacterium]|nr:sugar ABC transporter ATP-binding protein [Clostridia bacterium]